MTAIHLCESHVQHEPVYMLHTEPQENDCVTRMQLGPHSCASVSANNRVDIKLKCTHIQDTIHFNLRPVVFAGYHHCCPGSREVYSHYLLNCHMGTIGLAVVAALLNSLPRLDLSCFV